ncbi:hypothetical protein QE363_003597 [Sphingomonas sp. SORGH_AS870]|nr:hypothetical protein [Sphingomonas sp. SORGH_AS_0870]
MQHPALVRAVVDLDRRIVHRLGPKLFGQGEVLFRNGARIAVIDAEADHLLGRGARADTDQQLAVGQLVENVDPLDEAHRVMQRHRRHRKAEMHVREFRRQIGCEHIAVAGDRHIAVEMVIRHEKRVETERGGPLGMAGQTMDQRAILVRRHGPCVEEYRETHQTSPFLSCLPWSGALPH